MKCFKKFFQHTWQPQQMVIVPSPGSIWDYPYLDQVTSVTSCLAYGTGPPKPEQKELYPPEIRNSETRMESPSRFELTKAEERSGGDETELGEVKVQPPTMSSVATSTPVQPGTVSPCRNGGCKSWASRTESRMESPWHFLKTVFLISVIAALILWVIVYTFLARYQIL